MTNEHDTKVVLERIKDQSELLKKRPTETLNDILRIAAARHSGKFSAPVDYNFPAPISNFLIDTLANMTVSMYFAASNPKRKIKIKEPPPLEVLTIIVMALPEIQKIYSSVMGAGGYGTKKYLTDTQRMDIALLRFDEAKTDVFKLLKKTYLEDTELYLDRGGQERKTFFKKLLKKITSGLGYNDLSEDDCFWIWRMVEQEE